jgi:lipopolysaccharide transport system ATP-binding protein
MRSVRPAISVSGVSKRYHLGGVLAERKLVDALGLTASKLTTMLRSPGGSRIREVNDFWALRDISFSVGSGEVVGIVGQNGAGKSTLLKIMSRITEPTSGEVTYMGRVGSLLEVGTGFHPELSGRDNIFLNGAILGMSRREIARRFDEIVAFAEVDTFIDVPVKRYSSGMYLRLAFAVSAHLETDILLIDEVLAVGDARFQQKCLSRMDEVARGGRTVLFVSHNLTSIKGLCKRTLVLDAGRLTADGETDQVLGGYLRHILPSEGVCMSRQWSDEDAPTSETVRAINVSVSAVGCTPADPIHVANDIAISGCFYNRRSAAYLNMSLELYNWEGLLLFDVGSWDEPLPLVQGTYVSSCVIPGNLLNDGDYFVTLTVRDKQNIVLTLPRVLKFRVLDSEGGRGSWFGKWEGIFRPRLQWKTEAVNDRDQHARTARASESGIFVRMVN